MKPSQYIYTNLPISVQNTAISMYGFFVNWSRYDKNFRDHFSAYKSREFSDYEYLRYYRDEKLRNFILYAARHVPYYRDLFAELELDPNDIRSVKDLEVLPVLQKKTVKDNLEQFYPERPVKFRKVKTSGTTGSGLVFRASQAALAEQWAVWWRYRRAHKIGFDTWCGYFGGRPIVPTSTAKPPFWRINLPAKQILFSVYHMNAESLWLYAQKIAESKIEWLHGYPSALALLSSFIIEDGGRWNFSVKKITIGAENLSVHQSQIIETAFNCKPIQHYGMAEGAANISECEKGTLHVDEDYSAVEFDVEVGNERNHRIIGTNFTNYAFPLIRYDVGDIAVLDEGGSCSCGRTGRIVSSIEGRSEDYLVLADGAKVGRLDHLFKDMVKIKEAQFYQQEFGRAKLRIVPTENFQSSDKEKLQQRVYDYLGNRIELQIVEVSNIPRENSGKLKFVVSEIGENQ